LQPSSAAFYFPKYVEAPFNLVGSEIAETNRQPWLIGIGSVVRFLTADEKPGRSYFCTLSSFGRKFSITQIVADFQTKPDEKRARCCPSG
jgi:hypothetical protein